MLSYSIGQNVDQKCGSCRPPATRLFMCHDYKAPGRNVYAWETTVAEERAKNVHVKDGVGGLLRIWRVSITVTWPKA